MMRRPYYALNLAGIAAGCLLLTHSLAFQRHSLSPAAIPKPNSPARLSPGGRFTPFPPKSPPEILGHAGGELRRPSEPAESVKRWTEQSSRPTNRAIEAHPTLIIQHDPTELMAGRPAQLQILLSRASSTDTRVELSTNSPALNLPRSIVIPAGHALAGIRLVPLARTNENVTVTATAAHPAAPGGKIASQSILSIQAQPNKREDRK